MHQVPYHPIGCLHVSPGTRRSLFATLVETSARVKPTSANERTNARPKRPRKNAPPIAFE
jgi:hypothetical protein